MQNGRVLAGILIACCIGAVGAGIKTWAQADANTKAVVEQEKRCASRHEEMKQVPEQVTRMDERQMQIKKKQDKMDDKLDKIIAALPAR